MEDRLLGEKLHYYCSSSEDEGDGKEEDKETQQEDEEGGFNREKSKEAQAEKIAGQEWKGVSKRSAQCFTIETFLVVSTSMRRALYFAELPQRLYRHLQIWTVVLVMKLPVPCQREITFRGAIS